MWLEIGHFGKPGFLKVAIYGNCVAKRKIVIFKIIHRLLLSQFLQIVNYKSLYVRNISFSMPNPISMRETCQQCQYLRCRYCLQLVNHRPQIVSHPEESAIPCFAAAVSKSMKLVVSSFRYIFLRSTDSIGGTICIERNEMRISTVKSTQKKEQLL